MTDQTGSSGDDMIIDQLIDDVVAAGTGMAEPGNADAGLLVALAELSPVEWPAEETGGTIAARVAARSGRRRRRTIAAAVIATAAAAALIIAGALQLTGGTPGTGRAGAGPSTAAPRSTAPSRPGPVPETVAAMTIVSQPGALRAVGVIGSGNDFLFCPTSRVCYIQGYRNPAHAEFARTLDGGVTWKEGAALPRFPANEEWDAQLSCPRPLTCFSGYASGLLVTSDGFVHARVLPVTSPGNQVGTVACPTVLDCVAVVIHGDGTKTLVRTSNGGAAWTAMNAPVIKVSESVGDLNCGRDGDCIALLLGGTSTNAKVSALSSQDGGRTWSTAVRPASIGDQEEWRFDCGDSRNCVVTGNNGNLAWIRVGRGGHISIQVRPYPKSWPQGGDDVGCATGRDCFIEVTTIVGGTDYTDNVIEVTHNGGRTWAAAMKTPIASTFLSCPVPRGCIAVAPKNPSTLVVLSNLRQAG